MNFIYTGLLSSDIPNIDVFTDVAIWPAYLVSCQLKTQTEKLERYYESEDASTKHSSK
jgi:hypothetical protein